MPFLCIQKPAGITSHDVVDRVRRLVRMQGFSEGDSSLRLRVGHGGTLDPFASGLLVVAVGRDDTRRLQAFLSLEKTYHVRMRLGAFSDTDDSTGRIQPPENGRKDVSEEEAIRILDFLEGPVLQVPPAYSAKKVKGKKLYEYARKGESVQRTPCWRMVYAMYDRTFDGRKGKQEIQCAVRVSSGTYIRALARSVGERLGVGAYASTLERTAVGPFSVSEAITLEQLEREGWRMHARSWREMSSRIPSSAVRIVVFGTFDTLHDGHRHFFQQARALAAEERELIVGVGRDIVVRSIKARAPVHSEYERLQAVRREQSVDAAYLLPEDVSLRFGWIAALRPDIIALGYDQTAFVDGLAEGLAREGVSPRIVRLKPFEPHQYKSSLLRGMEEG